MTVPSLVSVSLHWGASNIWVVSGQREFCCSADLRREPASGPGTTGENAIDYVDDDYVDVDGRIVPTVLELARLISSAMDGCGIVDADILYLSHPSDWGAPRRRRLLDAARRVAHDVVLVPTSVAAARSARTAWRSRCVVLELCGGMVVASVVVEVDGELRIDGAQSSAIADVAGLFSGIGDLSVRDAVVLVGLRSHAVAASLERGSTNVHGHASIRILDESRVASSLVDPRTLVRQTTARDSSGRIVDNSAFGAGWVGDPDGAMSIPSVDSTASSPRRVGGWHGGRRRFAAALAVVAVVVAVAATVVVSTRDRGDSRLADSVAAAAEDKVEIVEASKEQEKPAPKTSIPSIESGVTPELTRVEVGSVAAELPSDWKLLSRGTSSGRTDLIPSSGADRKIVVIEKSLAEGAGFDSVEAALRQQFSAFEDPLRFGEFSVIDDAAGKQAVVYVEFPDDFSEVRWHVYVDNGRQVSIGCQYLVGEWDSLEADCLRMWQSLEFTP
ncbi:type VII secretion-associated protein [Rhodococcus erythropolis]|uniref:Type VII secretion-associated protein n=1 Tax=Rhodococcus erythropolis TaxID=1833 RepID=A0AAX3V953_RHOER|nr:type VII secretion-associated protein [Rhodococcus erythropolis]WGV51521.2 type VII secretion-associated protein [Rhodococcus erythropolis]